jgi:hypothetical protein
VSKLVLPAPDGTARTWVMHTPAGHPAAAAAPTSRSVYAAAHVVADPLRASMTAAGAVDWESTLRQRHRLWTLGLGVAEAMDTAQRGMGITWPDVQRLVDTTLAEARACGGRTVVGIATDTLPPGPAPLAAIVEAYLEQLTFVEERGGQAVIMASRQLAVSARDAEDYIHVYDAVISQAKRPVVLHWLGTAFDELLHGYWGAVRPDEAVATVLTILKEHPSAIDGIKVSLLDEAFEVDLRARVPEAVKIFTGDDYNYVDLVAGDGTRHSHALLGAFTAIAPFARAALARLDHGDIAGYREILEPTLPLSRLVFEAPTAYYKTGIAWLAYLQGHQSHFRMLGGLEAGRSVQHLIAVFCAADEIGLFDDPELAQLRLTRYLHALGLD